MRHRRQNKTGGERTFTVNKTTPITTVTTTLSNSTATSEEIRKMKRRQYQQKRRQSVAANNKSDLSGNLVTMNVMGVTIPLAVSLANNNNQNLFIGYGFLGHHSTGTRRCCRKCKSQHFRIGTDDTDRNGRQCLYSFDSQSDCQENKPQRIEIRGNCGLWRIYRIRHGSNPHGFVAVDGPQEPQLGRGCVSSTVTSVFGAGDLFPFASRIQSHNNNNKYSNYSASAVKVDRNGLLKGSYGSAHLTGVSDYYNNRSFGDIRTTSDSQTSIIVEVPYFKWFRYSVHRCFNRFITREFS